jgi:hypothetical protein
MIRPDPFAKLHNRPVESDDAELSPIVAAPGRDASGELRRYLEDVTTGAIRCISWPWPMLSEMTFALLPGCVTCVVGDAGVGKTFFVLQCLRHWMALNVKCAVFFIEKDRRFHTHRLLAQIAGRGELTDYNYLDRIDNKAIGLLSEHAAEIDEIGKYIHSAPRQRVTLAGLIGWTRDQLRDGARIVVIDPITAAAAGAQRWESDDEFVIKIQSLCTDYGASVVLITHAKKGNRPGAPSGHDMAGGAAYHRFTDTTIWINRTQKRRNVQYLTAAGPTTGKIGVFFQMHKTRNGRGSGREIAFEFGKTLLFAEQGIVLKEAPKDPSEDLI